MNVADISGILAQFGSLVKIVADILRICLRLRLGKVCRGHSEVSQREKVVPGGVLEFSPLCNDQQTHPAGITQRPKLPVLANMHHSSFNLPFMT